MELLTYIWIFFSYFGDIAYWLGFTISFLLIYPFLDKKDKEKQKWILLYLLPAVLLSYFFSFFLKIIFKIPRICVGLEYCPSTYSFPSGHAAIASAFFSIVFIKFSKNPKLYLPILLISILTSYSRIALKVHTFYDILGGVLVGTLISFIWYFFFKRIESGENHISFYFRKLIHLSGLLAIIIYLIYKNYAFYLLLFLTILFLLSEILRIKNIYLPVLHEISNFCKKREEKSFLLEPFLFKLSICMLTILPKELFLAGSIPLVIGDSLAGLIGYRFGSHKLFYNKNKSIEGSLAFFISTLISFLLFFDVKTSLLLTLFSTMLESILKKYENLILPFGCVLFYLVLSKTLINIF